jgi:transcriptional regulator with GAF, ATPase, and Fis domain
MEEEMKSTTGWNNESLERLATRPAEKEVDPTNGSHLANLKNLTVRLLREVQSIRETHRLNIENGVDFYEEVRRFEIDLITRALFQTGGHQARAAKLLNLKITTLNSKIKHYNICLTGFVNVYPLADPDRGEAHQHA